MHVNYMAAETWKIINMTCERFETDVHEYLRETLPDDRRAEVEQHVAECSRCTELLSRTRELTCREFVEFLNHYVDGALESDRRSVFERHVDVCPDCKTYLQSYRRTMELSVSALRGDPLVQDEIPEEMIRAILDARK